MKIIGHRGALGLATENTIDSIKAAMRYKVDEIEFDVRVTRDKIPVLQHNSYVTGTRGGRYSIAKHNYKTLLKHRADLTTLEQVFKLTKHAIPLYIEVKPGEDTQPIVDCIRKHLSLYGNPHMLSIASYSQRVLLPLHKALPELDTIVIDNWSGIRATYRARQLNTKRLAMNRRWLYGAFIKSMSKRGWQISAFTLNDPVKARAWANCGLYAAVTNYPDRFEIE